MIIGGVGSPDIKLQLILLMPCFAPKHHRGGKKDFLRTIFIPSH